MRSSQCNWKKEGRNVVTYRAERHSFKYLDMLLLLSSRLCSSYYVPISGIRGLRPRGRISSRYDNAAPSIAKCYDFDSKFDAMNLQKVLWWTVYWKCRERSMLAPPLPIAVGLLTFSRSPGGRSASKSSDSSVQGLCCIMFAAISAFAKGLRWRIQVSVSLVCVAYHCMGGAWDPHRATRTQRTSMYLIAKHQRVARSFGKGEMPAAPETNIIGH